MKHNSYELLNPRLAVVIAEDGKLPALDGSLLTNLPGGELTAGVSSIGGKDGAITLSSDLSMSASSQLQIANTITRNTAGTQTITASTGDFSLAAMQGDMKLDVMAGDLLISVYGEDKQINVVGKTVFNAPVSLTAGISGYNGNVPNTANSILILNAQGKVDSKFLPEIPEEGVASIGGQKGAITVDSTLTIGSDKVLKVTDGVFLKPVMSSITGNKIDWTMGSTKLVVTGGASANSIAYTIGTAVFNITSNGFELSTGNGVIKTGAAAAAGDPSASIEMLSNSFLFKSLDGTATYLTLGTTATFSGTVDATGFTVNGAAMNAANGIPTLDAQGKIKSSQLPDLPEDGVVSIDGKKGAMTTDNTLTVSDSNVIGVTAGTFMLLTNTSDVVATTTGSFSFQATGGAIRFSSTDNNFTGAVTMSDAVTMSGAVAITGPMTYAGAAMNAANGIPTLDGQGKLKAAQLPPIAITEVLPVEADGTSDLTTLLRKAATDKGLAEVQSGEIIVISRPAEDPDPAPAESYWKGVCGNYLVNATTAVSELEPADCIKTYMPDVSITVNGVAAVDGNITLNLANIADVTESQATLLKSIKVENGVPSIQNVQLATVDQVKQTYTIDRETIALSSLTTTDTTWPAAGEFYAYRNDGTVVVRINRAGAAAATVARTFLEAWLITSSDKEYIMPDITQVTQGEGNAIDTTFLVLTLEFGSGANFTGISLEIGMLSPVVATA